MPDETMRAELPTLPQSLLDKLGWYGYAHVDGVGEAERIHRWQEVINGVKDYTLSVLTDRASRASAAPGGEPVAQAAREVGKWLNERPNRPIDLEAVAQLVRFAQAPSDAGQRAECEWTPEDDVHMPGTYASACGELWSFIDGGPIDNGVKFCHGCGKPVKLRPALSESEGSSNG